MILSSCGDKNVSDVEIVEISESVRSEAIELREKIIPFVEPHIYGYEFFVYNDSVLLVGNRMNNEEKSLKVYTYPELKFIADFIPFGRGPGEVMSPMFSMSGDNLIMNDPNFRYNFIIPVDSLLNKDYMPPYNNHGVDCLGIAEYSKDSLIGDNPYYFKDDENGIGNDAKRLVVISKTNTLNRDVVFGKHKYYAGMISDGNIIANKDKKVIVHTGAYFPNIEMYDYDLNLTKIIKAPGEFKYNYSMVANNMVRLKHTVYCFSDLFYSDNYFYTSYIGSYAKGNDASQGDYETLIFKFDWDGNLVETYKYAKRIYSFSVSNDKNTFYALTLDDQEDYTLVELTK